MTTAVLTKPAVEMSVYPEDRNPNVDAHFLAARALISFLKLSDGPDKAGGIDSQIDELKGACKVPLEAPPESESAQPGK